MQCFNCAFQASVVPGASTIKTAHRVRCARSYATDLAEEVLLCLLQRSGSRTLALRGLAGV